MYYIIQLGLFKEKKHDMLVELLERYGLEYEITPFVPFVEDIKFKTDRTDVWCWGSVNMATRIKSKKFNPGSMHNENHDMEIYGAHYGDNMLNSDGITVDFGDELPESVPFTFFARPTRDSKMFSGQLFTKDKYKQWQNEIADSNLVQGLKKQSRILVAPLKQTTEEIRTWIVDGKVVTLSRYRQGEKLSVENYDNHLEAKAFAQSMADIFCPAEAFVLDVCLWEDKWKVVEINTINCSGWYDCDMSKLIQALELKFNDEKV